MDLDRLRAWTFERQCLGSANAASPLAALKSVVAVYATHPTCPLALRVRSRAFSPAAYRRIDRDRKGIRIPAMRLSVFLVPADTAEKIFSAVRPSEAHAFRPLKWRKMSMQTFERAAKRVLAAARDPKTTRELEEAAGMKGEELAGVLRALRYQGRLLTNAGESLLSSPHRYVAASEVVPEGLDDGDKADALAWLAGEYLRAFGPARVEDFAWWTGATKTASRAAIAAQATIDVGDGLLLRTQDEAAFSRTKRLGSSVVLLPKWDSYTMGLAPDGRQRFVHPDVQKRVYTPQGTGLPGDGNPVVLVNGEAAGIWNFTVKDGPTVEMFDTAGPKVRGSVDAELDAIASLLTAR